MSLEPELSAAAAPLDADVGLPLIVDLDQTLVLTDTLYEGFARLVFQRPLAALALPLTLVKGRAALKARLSQLMACDPAGLPYRQPLCDLIGVERQRGRSVHLVTAADQSVADAVADHLGFFDGALGSDGVRNLKGRNKLAALKAQFPDGFLYAGDHAADLPLFTAAKGAILCDVSPGVAAAARRDGVILARLERPSATPKTWLKAMRVHQWSKNVLIFVPLVLGHAWHDPARILAAAIGFSLFCVMASATYMLNDLADLAADRAHQTKRLRPFAAGDLPIRSGLLLAPILIAATLAGGWLLSPPFAACMAAYLILTLAYSFSLKRAPLLDVFVISALFTLRVVLGTLVIDVPLSPWLLSFSGMFFFSLSLAKRHVEVMRAAEIGAEGVRGRGYRGSDWPITLAFGVGAGLISVLVMLLYLANDAMPSGFYARPAALYAVPALVTLWLMRIWLFSNRMELDDDPIVFALKDSPSLWLGVATALAVMVAI
jgi:4-hydroxybenzoate polyprenyltransferase/phosphoserine phosphatase